MRVRGFLIWGIQVIVCAIAFAIFFGVVVGKRGVDLVGFVAALSLLVPTVAWLRTRSQRSR